MRLAPLALLPASVLGLLKEVMRHLLKRPVVGVCAAAQTPDGRFVLIRRGDTGTWGLPGGTLEWGETLRDCIARELLEEAGVKVSNYERLVGVYSRPDRDPRFHAVTIVVKMNVEPPSIPPMNSLEIAEVGVFSVDELPTDMAMGTGDMLKDALHNAVSNAPASFE